VMPNPLLAAVNVPLVAVSWKLVPALLREMPLNVARPATAFTVVVPLSDAPPLTVSETEFVAVVTRAPAADSSSTSTEKVCPATAVPGSVLNRMKLTVGAGGGVVVVVGGVTAMLPELLQEANSPAASMAATPAYDLFESRGRTILTLWLWL